MCLKHKGLYYKEKKYLGWYLVFFSHNVFAKVKKRHCPILLLCCFRFHLADNPDILSLFTVFQGFLLWEPHHEKTWFFHIGKQRHRSAARVMAQLTTPCFCNRPSTSQIRNFKHLAILWGCTAQFVLDLVWNSWRQVFLWRDSYD